MSQQKTKIRVGSALAGVLLLVAANSTLMADEVSLAYIGSNAGTQTITVDSASASDDLSQVAGLLGANGASVSHNPNAGSGSLADIAKALTEAAPMYAADIAQALAVMAPDQAEAIVAAVNSVAGVNTNAVLSAVHFGDPVRIVVPPLDKGTGIGGNLPVIEKPASKN